MVVPSKPVVGFGAAPVPPDVVAAPLVAAPDVADVAVVVAVVPAGAFVVAELDLLLLPHAAATAASAVAAASTRIACLVFMLLTPPYLSVRAVNTRTATW
jgi:hypothetical protein